MELHEQVDVSVEEVEVQTEKTKEEEEDEAVGLSDLSGGESRVDEDVEQLVEQEDE